MSVVYALYDALVSINVPTEKAKAVIDAMEREMMDKVATKSDVENLRLATKADLAEFGRTLTTQLYVAVTGSVALTCSILGTLIVFLR